MGHSSDTGQTGGLDLRVPGGVCVHGGHGLDVGYDNISNHNRRYSVLLHRLDRLVKEVVESCPSIKCLKIRVKRVGAFQTSPAEASVCLRLE